MAISGGDIPWREGLHLNCKYCGDPIEEKGASLIGPPSKHMRKVFDLKEDTDVCAKFHFCVKCYDLIFEKFIITKKKKKCCGNCKGHNTDD